MGLRFLMAVLVTLCMAGAAFGATVYLKDGSRETGNSVWMEGDRVYLSRSQTLFEYPEDDVLLEKTQKFNRIAKFADTAILDAKDVSAAGAASSDLVEQILAGSKFDQQIDKFLLQFQAGAMSSIGDNRELGDVFSQALAGFDPQKAKRRIRAYYRSHLDNGTLEAILAWMKSPLGIKVRDAETAVDVMSPEAAQRILNEMEGNPPPPRRRTLIRELDDASRSTQMARQIMGDAIFGAMSAIPARSAEKRRARGEMLKQIRRHRGEMDAQLRNQVRIGLTYTFRDFTDNELREYVAFMRTAPAVKFTKATMGAMSEMTRALSASMVRQIVRAAEEKYGPVEP